MYTGIPASLEKSLERLQAKLVISTKVYFVWLIHLGFSVPSAKFVMNSELVTNIYRIAEAKALEDKLAKEKKALEEYLKKVGQTFFCTFDCKIYHHPFQILKLSLCKLRTRWSTSRRWRRRTKP